ncbi:transposon Ty3-I Gag-Pol polyprotein [Trichonephila clavipes]|uniref:Transposon Ty3-I Gag-Pol polyprotein n=1 Tax=Trichonephila clavipes TaxID=2585209 RepID=A0A8X6W8Z6_TRICX|nr:transposon Ty3-I Gag-Pol polyprotein [Trichonephila clavipes]
MTVAESQQKVNLKASSNVILIPLHRSVKRKYSQDKGGMEKLAWKLPDFIKRIDIMKQNRDQDPTDFIYDQLKVHKKLGLRMTEEALVDHIFVRLEIQVQDYGENTYVLTSLVTPLVLDFDRKALAIPDPQIEKVVTTIEEGNEEIDLTKTRKNNGFPPENPEAYRFAVDYRKLNAITNYPRYPLPLIDDLTTKIPHTTIKLTLDLRSGYFQLEVNPSDIVKTAFVTKNSTYAFRRMPFGLSGRLPTFRRR